MKIIGKNRKESIDWVQDSLGGFCPRTTAEATFFGLLEEGSIITCKNAYILTENVDQGTLRGKADLELKKRAKVKRRPPRPCKQNSVREHRNHQGDKHSDHKHHKKHRRDFQDQRDSSQDDGDLQTTLVPKNKT